MNTRLRGFRLRGAERQRGQAGILAAVLVALVVVGVVISTGTPSPIAITNQQVDRTARTMAEVRDALIAWSVSRNPATDGVNARPGELPCPDINPLDGYEDGSCVAGALGRVPWRTLGIPEPRDWAGETLWYTMAGPFRKHNNSSAPITSDTVGNITVYKDDTTTTLSSQVVAVIFAPGPALGTQDRSTAANMDCPAPSGFYPRNLCASNYLDSNRGIDNARINGPFVQAAASDTFNDRLLYITNADLMAAVEQRAARELIGYLNLYRSTTGVYPWADLGDGNSNASSSPTPNYYNRNRFPCGNALPYGWGRTTVPQTPTLPNWLTNGCGSPPTGWQGIIYYAVARNRLQDGGSDCTTCTANTLSVSNSGGNTAILCSTAAIPGCAPAVVSSGSADLVLMTAGANTTGRGPPDSGPTNDWPINYWTTISSDYFSDSENRDNNDDSFVVPSSTGTNRNRIYVVR